MPYVHRCDSTAWQNLPAIWATAESAVMSLAVLLEAIITGPEGVHAEIWPMPERMMRMPLGIASVKNFGDERENRWFMRYITSNYGSETGEGSTI